MLLWKIHHTIFTLSHVLCFFIKFLVFKSFSGFNLSFWNAVMKNSLHHIHTFSCALPFHQVPCFQIFLRVQLKFLKCCREKFFTQLILQWPCVRCWRKIIFTLKNCPKLYDNYFPYLLKINSLFENTFS